MKASAPESDSEVKATIIAIVTYDRGYCSFVPFFLFLFPSIFFYYYFYLLPFCWGAGEGEGGGAFVLDRLR